MVTSEGVRVIVGRIWDTEIWGLLATRLLILLTSTG
eukprot:COSAG02_NODE_926_length_15856_cov_13.975566_16_plen_36_part_00